MGGTDYDGVFDFDDLANDPRIFRPPFSQPETFSLDSKLFEFTDSPPPLGPQSETSDE